MEGTSSGDSVVAMDEAGNTGEDLLNADQPAYAVAGLHIAQDRAQALVDEALKDRQASELKFMTLRKRAYGPPLLKQILTKANLTPEEARIAVVHKPWMVTAKMVDLLVEPAMLAKGLQAAFYASGAHVRMATDLYRRAPATIGVEVWRNLQRAFVAMVRDYDDDTVEAYLRALRQARIACRDERLRDVLRVMLDTRERLDAEVRDSTDALDPSPATVVWQAAEWSEQFDGFSIVHDDADAVERWSEHLVKAGGAEVSHIELGEVVVKFPLGLSGITFTRSQDDPRVQLADLLAGAGAWVYAGLSGLRSEDELVRELETVGLPRLIQHFLGPPVDPAMAARLSPS